jgi:hypothetical protein
MSLADLAVTERSTYLAMLAALEDYDFRGRARWLGAITPAGSKVAGETMVAFQPISGNDAYGDPLQILDTADTPQIAGKTKFTIDALLINARSATTAYRLQIIYGTGTAAAAITAGQYTDVMLRLDGTTGLRVPLLVRCPVLAVTTKAWVRIWNATNGATVDLFFSVHEYLE